MFCDPNPLGLQGRLSLTGLCLDARHQVAHRVAAGGRGVDRAEPWGQMLCPWVDQLPAPSLGSSPAKQSCQEAEAQTCPMGEPPHPRDAELPRPPEHPRPRPAWLAPA